MRAFTASLTVSLALVACGDDGNNKLADGSIHDGSGSAGSDAGVDAPTLPVTLTVTNGGSAAAGVKVYFLNADSSVVANTSTGSDGVASAVMAAGGSVTAIEPSRGLQPPPGFGLSTDKLVDTFAGVKPGDNLHLDLNNFGQQGSDTSFTLTFPAPDSLDVTEIDLQTTCGEQTVFTSSGEQPEPLRAKAHPFGGQPQALTSLVTLSGCGGTADMALVELDNDGDVIGTIYAPAQPVVQGQGVTLTGAYSASTATDVRYNHVQGTDGVSVSKEIVTARGEVFDESTELEPDLGSDDSGSGSGTLAGELSYPPASLFTGAAQIVESRLEAANNTFSRQSFFEWSAPSDGYTLDLSTVQLADYATVPQFDAATHAITWTATPTGLTPDFVQSVIRVQRTANDVSTAWLWIIAAPAPDASVHFPTLPTDVFDFNATADDNTSLFELTTAKVPGGYDAVRAHAIAFDSFDVTGLVVAAPTGGRASIAELQNVTLRSKHHRRQLHAPRKHPRAAMYTRHH